MATIYLTDLTDTMDTFRQNVNNSLSNLNTELTNKSISSLTDTAITSPNAGEFLRYNAGTGKWENQAVTIPSSLSDLSDVTISSPADGQVLLYDSTTGVWKNGTVTVPSSLSDLTDVTITSPATGHILVFSGGAWVNMAHSHDLESLTDVDINSPASGEFLMFDSGTSSWRNQAVSIPDNLTELVDVNAPSPSTGDFLRYSVAGEWVAQTASLTDLTDVNITNPGEGHVLQYRSGEWVNVANAIAQLDNVHLTHGYVWRGNSSDVAEETNSLFITDTGDVGIGTTTPRERLDIGDGSIALTRGVSRIQAYDPSTGNTRAYIHFPSSGADPNRISFNVPGGGDVFVVGGTVANSVRVNGDAYITGNVGIGTTTPTAKLHVAGGGVRIAAGNHWVYGGTGDVYGLVFEDNGGNVDWSLGTGGTGGEYFYLSSRGPADTRLDIFQAEHTYGNAAFLNSLRVGMFVSGSAGNARLNVAGSVAIGASYVTSNPPTNGLIVEGGVGIGTTNPTSRLSVAGGADLQEYIDLDADVGSRGVRSLRVKKQTGASSGDDTYFDVGFNATNDWWTIQQFTTNAGVRKDLAVRISGNHDLYITTAGNVGIGTNTPEARLDIAGGSLYLPNAGVSGPSLSGNGLYLRDASGVARMALYRASGNATRLSNGGVGNVYVDLYNNYKFTIVRGEDATVVPLSVNPNLNSVSLGTEMSITTRLYVYGTTEDVSKTAHGLMVIGDVAGLNLALDGNEIMARNNGSASSLYLNNEGGGVYIGAASPATFNVNGSALHVTQSGLVGIGTSSPATKLHVEGDAKVAGDATNADLWVGDNTKHSYIYVGDSRLVKWKNGGNFHIDSMGTQTLYLQYYSDPSSRVVIGGGTGQNVTSFTVSPTGNSYINALGGNVGIGTIAPSERLHVDFTDLSGHHYILAQSNNSDGATTGFKAKRNVGAIIVGMTNNGLDPHGRIEVQNAGSYVGDLRFFVNGAERMRIEDDGSVGIGITAPAATLHVNGTAKYRNEVKQVSGNYSLISLDNRTIIEQTSSSASTITLPANVFSGGEVVTIVKAGTGDVTIAAGSGLTLHDPNSQATITTQWDARTVYFRSATEAVLI